MKAGFRPVNVPRIFHCEKNMQFLYSDNKYSRVGRMICHGKHKPNRKWKSLKLKRYMGWIHCNPRNEKFSIDQLTYHHTFSIGYFWAFESFLNSIRFELHVKVTKRSGWLMHMTQSTYVRHWQKSQPTNIIYISFDTNYIAYLRAMGMLL